MLSTQAAALFKGLRSARNKTLVQKVTLYLRRLSEFGVTEKLLL